MSALWDRPTPPGAALLAGGALALAYALALLGLDFASGRSPFWIAPRGLSGSYLDIQSVLASYQWFASTPWGMPLLHIPAMNAPEGMNGYNADFVPLAALLGKAASRATGQLLNPYPAWVVATFALNAMAVVALCRALGARSLAAALAAGALAAMMPMLHLRFGHLGHAAHWPFVLALAALVAADRGAWPARRVAVVAVAMSALSPLVNLYVFVLAFSLSQAALLRLLAARRLPPGTWAGLALLSLALPLAILWACGVFGIARIGEQTTAFGRYSANLVSLVWPQSSAILAATRIPQLSLSIVDATDGQYEGYAYLGLGTLLLLALAAWLNRRALVPLLARHWFPLLAVGLFAAWAVLPSPTLMWRPLFTIPVPDILESTVFGWFRSNGRFLWPASYGLLALAVAGVALRAGRHAIWVLALAVAVQWADLATWRARVAEAAAARDHSVLAAEAPVARAAVAREGFVQLFPKIFCTGAGSLYHLPENRLAMDFHLVASREGAAMPLVFKARGNEPCGGPEALLLRDGRARTPVFVFEEAVARPDLRPLLEGLDCRPLARGLLCERPVPPGGG